jgi:hypothetical protein
MMQNQTAENDDSTFIFLGKDNKQFTVRRLLGSESLEEKAQWISQLEQYLSVNVHLTWSTAAKTFTIKGSPAYTLISGCESIESFKEQLNMLSEMATSGCTNFFGTLCKGLSLPASPIAQSAVILSYQKSMRKMALKSFAQNEQPTAEQLALIEGTLRIIAKDQFCSLIYPAIEYSGDKKLTECSREDLATYYTNYSKANKLKICFSCEKGVTKPNWLPESAKFRVVEIEEQRSVVTSNNSNSSDSNHFRRRDASTPFPKQKKHDGLLNTTPSWQRYKRKRDAIDNNKPWCDHCQKKGHNTNGCWIKYPELKPANRPSKSGTMNDVKERIAVSHLGGGKRFFFRSILRVNEKDFVVLSLKDSGSTVSCISSNFVREASIKTFSIERQRKQEVSSNEDTSSLEGIRFSTMNNDNQLNIANKYCFVNLASVDSPFKISFPALVLDNSHEAMQGAEVLIGNDVLGSLIGLNIPLDGPAKLSFWDNNSKNSNKKLITVMLTEHLGDRMIGHNFTSNLDSMQVEGLAPKGDGDNNKHSFELEHQDERDQMILEGLDSQENDTNDSKYLDTVSKSNKSADLSERVLKDCGVIDTTGWNPTPATLKLLFELKALRKELDATVIPKESELDVRSKGKKSRQARRLREQQIKNIAQLENRKQSLEFRIAVIQQRLNLKKKKFRKATQRKARLNKNKEIQAKLKDIPRYPTIPNSIQKPKDHSEVVTAAMNVCAEALKVYPKSNKERKDLIMQYANKEISKFEEDAEHTDEFLSAIKTTIERTEATFNDQGIDWMNVPKERETYVLHSLNAEQHDELSRVFKDYSTVLVPDDGEIKMGQANSEFAFDIELIEGGEQQLRNRKNRAYPCKKPVKDLLNQALDDMERNKVGIRDPANCSHAFPGFMVSVHAAIN